MADVRLKKIRETREVQIIFLHTQSSELQFFDITPNNFLQITFYTNFKYPQNGECAFQFTCALGTS